VVDNSAREGYRRLFRGFDPKVVARFTARDVSAFSRILQSFVTDSRSSRRSRNAARVLEVQESSEA
jgi:3-methyladenine DNA glycosylase Tag